jgi:hypothetical protein
MTHSVSFNARALFTWTPDRIYRVEVRNGRLYFLRVGGQFDLDRGGMACRLSGGRRQILGSSKSAI